MKIIITGGAGFIGSNAASRFLQRGDHVIVIDNLSREGVQKNLDWLRSQGRLEFVRLDIRDSGELTRVFRQHRDADRVLHLAAQVAVTTSVESPRHDFESNAIGTFNVLEAMRHVRMGARLLYASTNKVYGEMTDVPTVEKKSSYCYQSLPSGISEERRLDFHSPYGCSKGAADQYVLDYYRVYGLSTIVFRQSCIYGYRQFGAEDQGWVAWFIIASQLGQTVTIFGDGKQVRDILFVDDLLDAYDAAFAADNRILGRAYNIGGGPTNVLSLLDLIRFLKQQREENLCIEFDKWRPGDQKVFISDIRRARQELGWFPRVNCQRGLALLHRWVAENKGLFVKSSAAVA
jgi:CDP-paratose 2-epimerase